MFNENSGLVGIWCNFVKTNPDKREQVPNLSNLREVVYKKLDEGETQAQAKFYFYCQKQKEFLSCFQNYSMQK